MSLGYSVSPMNQYAIYRAQTRAINISISPLPAHVPELSNSSLLDIQKSIL